MSKDDVVKKFGRRVRQIRHAKGLSQTLLAERIGTEQASISLLENGKQEPRLKLICELAGGLKVSLSELFADF